MNEQIVEMGSSAADEKFQVKIVEEGPYLVLGAPPLKQWFIIPDAEGVSWSYQGGDSYQLAGEHVALCRCGYSHKKPYCDGSHATADWDPALTASDEPLLDEAEFFAGPRLTLSDNRRYCVFARFCDARGRVWNLVNESANSEAAELTIREANHCPSARLSAWNNQTKRPYEPHYLPSLGLLEDPAIGVSGGLWVRGGIAIKREDGRMYEIRNRVVLCRCGHSDNKPYCDGNHVSARFDDKLNKIPDGIDAE